MSKMEIILYRCYYPHTSRDSVSPVCKIIIIIKLFNTHIVPFGKFHRIRGAPPETFPHVKYDAPEEVGGARIFFDSPIRK